MSTPEEKIEAERERQYEVRRQERIAANSKPRSWAGFVLIMMVLCLCFGVLLAAFVVRRANTNSIFGTISTALLGDRTDTVSAPVVVSQIQRLNRLETVQYNVDTVVEGHRTSALNALPDLLVGDRLLLVVHGQVIAGVDLSQLKPESVRINGKAIQVDLPPSIIFSSRIDEAKTRVFARSTGLLVPVDPNLETDTRRSAETQVQDAATKDGILDTARNNARSSVESLLRGFGFQQVTVR
ncbi:DUF4230 domain-containing protein [Terriglobus aquaticus]|uniref:DUF4230 domain-containing protein n=1 Tax=Terriglobus aquaticus TaxID=940139 RepID=A0ABW9KMK8_9BACT|nr:DUF4230 domain-containing protein [Terriglobus aquaticus]